MNRAVIRIKIMAFMCRMVGLQACIENDAGKGQRSLPSRLRVEGNLLPCLPLIHVYTLSRGS